MEQIKIFMMMPYSEAFLPVWEQLKIYIPQSEMRLHIQAIRLDEVYRAGHIFTDILQALKGAMIGIADITRNNPNVLWEAGYCEALGKPVIYLTQDIREVPFDLKHTRIIEYKMNELPKLGEKIQVAVRETFLTMNLPSVNSRDFIITTKMLEKTIAVTGSVEADSNIRQKMTSILAMFLGKNIKWLCGAFGDSDEHIIRFLSGHGENVQVVGYDEKNISKAIDKICREKEIPFIDASAERLPVMTKNEGANLNRDLYFLMKADLVIFFWAENSPWLETLIDWFSTQKKDLVLIHI
nr:hypothetical protein [Candidatus Sigynarchaeota archaeon]